MIVPPGQDESVEKKEKDIERKKNIGERNLTDSVKKKDVGLIQVKE